MSTVRFISGKAALAKFIGGITDEARDRLESSGYNASGKLSRSLRDEVFDIPGAAGASLYGLGHWRYVGNGRGPGKRPPAGPLAQWAKDKGLASDERSARAIAHRLQITIAREGTLDHQLGGKNVFDEIVRAAQPRIPEVVSAFLRDSTEPIVSQFKRTFAA